MRTYMDKKLSNFKPLKSHTRFLPFASYTFIASLFAMIVPNAQAANEKETPWYEVEVIIFANKEFSTAKTETWPENVETPGYHQALDLSLPGFKPLVAKLPPVNSRAAKSKSRNPNSQNMYANGAYALLDSEFLQLSSIARRIRSSSQYDVVLHLAWRQPTFDEKEATPVFVFDSMMQRDPVPQPLSNPNLGLEGYYFSNEEAGSYGPRFHWISGTLKLSVSRYLHLESDLHVKMKTTVQEVIEESPPQESGGFGSFFGISSEPTPITIERPVLQDYRLFETRRMRSKEIHYFDHPLVGIVVKVTPYELEVPSAKPQPIKTSKNTNLR